MGPMIDSKIIRNRLDSWTRKRNLADLWPGLRSEHYWSAVARLVRLTADVLGNRQPERLITPHGSTVRALGIAGFVSGVGPLIGYWIEQGVVQADDEIAALFGEHLEHGRRRAALLSVELTRLLRQFEGHQLGVTVLKGVHVGRDYYPEPGARPSTDIDLLVDAGKAEEAAAVLSRLGFVKGITDRLSHRGDWHLPDLGDPRSLELTHAESPWSIDLHATLDRRFNYSVVGAFGELASVARANLSDELPGVQVMKSASLLAYLAFHASSGFDCVRLILLVDMVLVIRRDFAPDPDAWAGFEREIRTRGIARFVYPALSVVAQLVPGIVSTETMARLGSWTPRRIRNRVARATPLSTQRLGDPTVSARLMWLTSAKDILRWVVGMVWPRYPDRTRASIFINRWRLLQSALRRSGTPIESTGSRGSTDPE
jgi:hypothetical protein